MVTTMLHNVVVLELVNMLANPYG